MPNIIISYRRSDTQAIVGRIFDRLAARYGASSIFVDIDAIPLGTDFRKHIGQMLTQADVVLAVIGGQWTGPRHEAPDRIHQASDPVRIEIELAISAGVPIIPLLVDGAQMPGDTMLPEALRDFSYVNAGRIDTGRDFHQHMERVIRAIDQIVGQKRKDRLIAAMPRHLVRTRPILSAVVAAAVGTLVIGSVFWAANIGQWSQRGTSADAKDPTATRVDPDIAPAPAASNSNIRTLIVEKGGTIGAVNVVLSWSGDADFDLYLQCPDSAVISFSQRVGCGGMLELDAVGKGAGPHIENIVWMAGSAPPGKYSVEVDRFQGSTEEFVVELLLDGKVVETHNSSVLSVSRRRRVFDFVLPYRRQQKG